MCAQKIMRTVNYLCLCLSVCYLTNIPRHSYGQTPASSLPRDNQAQSTSQDIAMNEWFFVYNCDLGTGIVAGTVYPAGQSTVRITQNLGSKDEIGFYGAKVPAKECDRIRDTILRSAYQQLPAPTTLPPTTATLTIGEGRAGQIPELKTFALTELPKTLRDVVASMNDFVEVVREAPIRVVRGAGKAASPQLKVGPPLKVEVSLTNIGTQPITLHNFLSRDANEKSVKLSLRKRTAQETAPPAESITVDLPLSSIEFISLTDHDEKPTAAKMELLAESELKLRIQQTAYLAPGHYDISLQFHFVSDGIDAAKTIDGVLGIDCGQIEIVDAP